MRKLQETSVPRRRRPALSKAQRRFQRFHRCSQHSRVRVRKYGIDLEGFKMKTGKKPRDWGKAVKLAVWSLIHEYVHEI